VIRALLFLIAIAAIALPAWATFHFREPAYLRQPALQALAEQSCRCARSQDTGAGKASCWRRFDMLAGPTSPRSAPSTGNCAGLVEHRRCYRSGACVTLEYRALSGKSSFCGAHEAVMARALFAEEGARILAPLADYFSAGNVGGGASPEMAAGFAAHGCPVQPRR
jgi:hypothetical protein